MERKQRKLYYKIDQGKAGHFPRHAGPKDGREAEPFFLQALQKCSALSQQVQKSGVGNRLINLISSVLSTLDHSLSQFPARGLLEQQRDLLPITNIKNPVPTLIKIPDSEGKPRGQKRTTKMKS